MSQSTFLLNPTSSTPFVEFNYSDGQLDIIGKRLPEASTHFYEQMSEMVREFLSSKHETLHVNISFEEVHVHADSDFITLLETIKSEAKGRKNVAVHWYYDGSDISQRKDVRDLMNNLGLSYHLHSYSS